MSRCGGTPKATNLANFVYGLVPKSLSKFSAAVISVRQMGAQFHPGLIFLASLLVSGTDPFPNRAGRARLGDLIYCTQPGCHRKRASGQALKSVADSSFLFARLNNKPNGAGRENSF